MSRPRIWSIIILLSCISLVAIVLAGYHSPLRVALALWFLLVCPGMAFIRLLHIESLVIELSLAVALSLSLDTVVSMGLVYSDLWSYELALAVLVWLTVVGLAIDQQRHIRDLMRSAHRP